MLCFWLLLLTFVVGRKEGRKRTKVEGAQSEQSIEDRTGQNVHIATIWLHVYVFTGALCFTYRYIWMCICMYMWLCLTSLRRQSKAPFCFRLRLPAYTVGEFGSEELAALTHCWCEINTGQRQRRGKEKRNLKKLTKEKKATQKHGQKTTTTKLELHKKKFLPVFLWQKHRNCGYIRTWRRFYVHVINDAATQLKERPKSPATPHRRQQQQHELILFTGCKQYSRRWEKRCVKSWNCSPTKTLRGVESRKGQTTTTIPPKHQQHPPTKQLRKVFQGTSAEYPDTKSQHIHSLTQ